MTPTDTLLPPARPRPRHVLAGVLAAALVAAVAVVAAAALRDPANVVHLSIQNGTDYQVNVEVKGAGDNAWLDLGDVGRGRTTTLEQIADQGAQWVFRFSYGGVDAGELTVSRADLARARWTLVVPPTVGTRLHDAGLRPSAF